MSSKPERDKPPRRIYRIDWEHNEHVKKLGYENQEEKIAEHGVSKSDIEEALFDNEFPTAITGQEEARDYEGPAYEVIGRNDGSQYLLIVVIYIGNHEGIILAAYFLSRDNRKERSKIQRYHELTGGILP